MNLPRLWLIFTPFQVNQSYSAFFSVAFAAFFFAMAFRIIGRLNLFEALVYSIMFCSSSVMLGIERANSDLIIFVLVALSLVLIESEGLKKSGGYIILFVAAMFKLYPAFAFITAFRENKRRAILILFLLVGLFGVYYYLTNPDIIRLKSNIGRGTSISYGGIIIFNVLERFLKSRGDELIVSKHILLVSALVLVFCLDIILFCLKPKKVFQEKKVNMFRAGAAIYVGTFIFVSNYDYRLIFLIFTVPQMLTWIREGDGLAAASTLALTAMLMTMWMSLSGRVFLAGEVMNWFLFGFYVYAILATLPAWCTKRFFGNRIPTESGVMR